MAHQDCKELHMALNTVLDKIGPAFKNLIYKDLEKCGVSFEPPCPSLEDVQKALDLAFGPEGAMLLTHAVQKELPK